MNINIKNKIFSILTLILFVFFLIILTKNINNPFYCILFENIIENNNTCKYII